MTTTAGGIELWLRGVGVLGPGLPGWAAAAAALRAPATWQHAATLVPAPSRLAANERRRAGTVVKAALAVADEAVAMADADPARLATVFTSSTGDPANCHALCEALAAADPAARIVSPTRFTNSVHNTPAGYWHIATHSMCASTSLAVFDASFGAGLLEAAVTCHVKGDDVLLVAYDVPYPEPLHALRPLPDTMAVALVLSPRSGVRPSAQRGPWALRVSLRAEPQPATPGADARLEALRGQIPAARALPLLAAMAQSCATAGVLLDAADGCTLEVAVERCP
ncbi:MAG: beta-ketoacyl synthase chain length factor [Rubrivivax sp.]|nr:beta-ketoacyl synthase chain length factor [Rubrivivax sp.]